MFAVVVRTGVVVVVFERHVLCAFGGQVSEARVECTFLANDAAYLTLSRAVTQLRRSEIVTPGVGLTVCVVCGVSNEKSGFRQSILPAISERVHHSIGLKGFSLGSDFHTPGHSAPKESHSSAFL